jgi:apolipoprotein N-acyltransferase
MMRYIPAILLSSVFWFLLGIHQFSQGKPIQPFSLMGSWLFWTVVLSLPFNALANAMRKRLHWPPSAILVLTPAIFLPVVLLWLTVAASTMSRHGISGDILFRSLILYLGTLPLTLSLLVTCRRTPPG